MSKRRHSRAQSDFELDVAGMWSSDIDSLEDWVPENPEDVFFCLQLFVGPVGGDTHYFQASVATPQGLQAHKERHRHQYRWSQPSLFVFPRYSWREVEQKILATVAECAAADFDDSLVNLRKHFDWEYENYLG